MINYKPKIDRTQVKIIHSETVKAKICRVQHYYQ